MVPAGQEWEAGGWFAQLPAMERARLHERGTARSFAQGATLFHEGDPSDWVLLLSDGRVKVASVTPDGRPVVLAVCSPGELIGEFSAIDGLPRSATATAIDSVQARVIRAEEFRTFLAGNARASLLLLASVCGRLRRSDRQLVDFVSLDAAGRVARRLVELAEQFGVPTADGTIRIDMPVTQDDLAGWTGSSREAVTKALHNLRDRGLITTGRRAITVLDLNGLRSLTT